MITTRSETLFQQAGKHLAGGVGSGTRSPRSGWLPAPVFVRSGERRVAHRRGRQRVPRLRDGPGPADPRPPAGRRDRRGHPHARAARLAGLAGPRPRGRGGRGRHRAHARRWSCCASRHSAPRRAMYALRFARAFTGRDAGAALRGPLPRLVGRDPLVGPPLRRTTLGRRRRADGAPGVDRHPAAQSARRCWSRAGTTSRRWSASSREHGDRDRGGDHRADPGQLRRHHARRRDILERLRELATDARRAADLRRGADRLPGRARRRPGLFGDRRPT